MGASASFEPLLLNHLFCNAPIANIGDSSGLKGSDTAGSLYITLHTADPEAGDQATSETTYTGYARVAVARSTAGWIVSSSKVSNAAAITFGACTAGTNTASHFGIGTGATTGSTGTLICSAALASNLSISAGITPNFAASTLTVSCL